MPKIKFAKRSMPPIECNTEETLMSQLQDAGVPVASSCGGFGICGKCCVKVLQGNENLPTMSDDERQCLEKNSSNSNKNRLSCQVKPSGDLLIDTGYW